MENEHTQLRRRLTALAAAAALGLSGGALAACGEDDAKDAGTDIENAAEDAANDVTDAAEDAGKAAEGAAEDAGNAAEDAANDVEGEVDGDN